MSTLSDQTLTCCDCRNGFLHSVKDQEFYAQQGFTAPKRCRPCRQAKKERNNAQGNGSNQPSSNVYHAPGDFNSAPTGGGGKRPKRGGDGTRGRRDNNSYDD